MSDESADLLARAAVARRERRPDDARHDLVKAVALCRREGSKRELIRALKGLGQIERDFGRVENAQPLYEEAVALCRQEDDPLALAHTVRHLGDIHQDLARPDLAEPCYVEALAIYRSHDGTSTLDLANAVRPSAILKQDAGEVDEARSLWEEAKGLYAAAGVQEGIDECSEAIKRLRSDCI